VKHKSVRDRIGSKYAPPLTCPAAYSSGVGADADHPGNYAFTGSSVIVKQAPRIVGELIHNPQSRAQRVDPHMVVRPQLAEELDHLRSRVRLILQDVLSGRGAIPDF
jgi:hypothetical protein